MPEWTPSSGAGAAAPPVVEYEAVIALDQIERSTLKFTADVPPEVRRRALEAPPEWAADTWQPAGKSDEVLALEKMKALLDFRAEMPLLNANETAQSLRGRFAGLAAARTDRVARQRRFKVKVQIDGAGLASWCFDSAISGTPIQGLEDGDPDLGLRVVLQNVSRAAIGERLGLVR